MSVNIEQKIALTGSAVFLSWAAHFGVEVPKTISAESPTSVSGPGLTFTPTPDNWDKQITNALATNTALAKERTLALIRVTQTAVTQEINAIKGTPTKTPMPTETPTPTVTRTPTLTPTATPTFTKEQIEIKQRAGLLPTNTITPIPKKIVTPTGEPKTKGQEGGFPWGILISIPLAASSAILVKRFLAKRRRRREDEDREVNGENPD